MPTDPAAPPLPTLERLRRELIRRWDTGFESVDDAVSYFDDLVRAARSESGDLLLRESAQQDQGGTGLTADAAVSAVPQGQLSHDANCNCVIIERVNGSERSFVPRPQGVCPEHGPDPTFYKPPPPTCQTCRFQIRGDRNCSKLLMPAGLDQKPRPGDDWFFCWFHSPKIGSGKKPSPEHSASTNRSEAPKASSSRGTQTP